MIIIVMLIAISLSIALCFLAIFYWNMRSGQYDDTYTPSVRMLFDSTPESKKQADKRHSKKDVSFRSQTKSPG